MRRKHWVLLAVLLIAMLALSGCGVPRTGVDVTTTAPSGPWQTFVVWPLAKSLIWLYELFIRIGMPYAWGFSIIAFTIIIKIVTFPLTWTQLKGMQAQKELQPKLKELQKKYGKDRDKLTQEQMKLYKEAGVNPMSGCLPLVVQMPILFGLYSALVALGPSLKDASFFWIPDLGYPTYSQGLKWIGEAFNAGTATFPATGYSGYMTLAAYLVLPALLIVSQLAMQKFMTPTPAGGDQGGMAGQMGYLMTAMFGFFTLQVPAGLTLYWVTSNLIQIAQQWFITSDRFRRGSPPKLDVNVVEGEVVGSQIMDGETDDGETSTAVTKKSSQTGGGKKGKRRKSKKR